MGVLQLPWIRSTNFTYPFKLEIGIWMGPEASNANIMCPTQSIVDSMAHSMYVSRDAFVPQYVCQPFALLFLFLSLSWVLCFFIKFGMVYSLADT
jgi:hypothetical protein